MSESVSDGAGETPAGNELAERLAAVAKAVGKQNQEEVIVGMLAVLRGHTGRIDGKALKPIVDKAGVPHRVGFLIERSLSEAMERLNKAADLIQFLHGGEHEINNHLASSLAKASDRLCLGRTSKIRVGDADAGAAELENLLDEINREQ